MRELMMFAALVIAVLFVGRTEISLNPFYIRMDGWMNVLGFIFFGIGFGLMNYDSHRRGREEGFKEGVEHVVQYAKEKMEAEKK